MQLSASTLPLDPNSALPAGLPVASGFGGVPTEGAATPGAFGLLLTAESATAAAPASPAEAPPAAPFCLGQNLAVPAELDSPSTTVPTLPAAPFTSTTTVATAIAAAVAPRELAAPDFGVSLATIESDEDPPLSTDGEPASAEDAAQSEPGEARPRAASDDTRSEPDTLARWLAANGFTPPPAPVLVPTPEPALASRPEAEPALIDGSATPMSPAGSTTVDTSTGSTTAPSADRTKPAAAIDGVASNHSPSVPVDGGRAGEATAPAARSATVFTRPTHAVRGSQVRAAYSGNPAPRSTASRFPSAQPSAESSANPTPTIVPAPAMAGENALPIPVAPSSPAPTSAPSAIAPANSAASAEVLLAQDQLQSIPISAPAAEPAQSVLAATDTSSEPASRVMRPEFGARVVRSGDSRSFFSAPSVVAEKMAAPAAVDAPAPAPAPASASAPAPRVAAGFGLPMGGPSNTDVDAANFAPTFADAQDVSVNSAPSTSTPALHRFATSTPTIPSAQPVAPLSQPTASVPVASQPFTSATVSMPSENPAVPVAPESAAIDQPRTEQITTASGVSTPTRPSVAPSRAASADSSSSNVTLVSLSSLADGAPEKFAAAPDQFADVAATLEKFGIKKSLTTDTEIVTERSSGLGINVAKSRDAMPTLAPTPVRPSIDDPSSTFSVPSLDFAALVKDQPQPSASELTGSARRAVESVIAVTDHFTTTGGQHGVNLKFMVSGIELAVRVEVRGGNVQTTFRTDSPELRAALAVEWHAVAATSEDRTQRLADPVFTSASGRDSLQSDQGGADQRGARQGQPAPEFANAPRAALRRPASLTSVAVAAPAPVASLSTTGRLHTFA